MTRDSSSVGCERGVSGSPFHPHRQSLVRGDADVGGELADQLLAFALAEADAGDIDRHTTVRRGRSKVLIRIIDEYHLVNQPCQGGALRATMARVCAS